MTSCALVGMGIVFLVVPLVRKAALATNLLQRGQDLHHTHQKPVPRLGGLALAAAFIGLDVFIAAVFPGTTSEDPGTGRPVVLVSSLAMFALGFWDDLKPLGAKRKLAGSDSYFGSRLSLSGRHPEVQDSVCHNDHRPRRLGDCDYRSYGWWG